MQDELLTKNNIQNAKKTMLKYNLCDSCLGRIYAKIGRYSSNASRGELVRKELKIKMQVESKNCSLCNGLISEIPIFTKLIYDSLKEYEYNTFLVGVIVDEDIILKEEEIFSYSKSENTESIKNELKREIGKKLEKTTKKIVDFKKPMIMAVIDTAYNIVDMQIESLYLYGKYQKFSRNIPQTKWFCKICRGKGCRKCKYTGKLYPDSVEELIAKFIIDITKGEDEKFHGAGREDIDVKMLGEGRPFIIEITNPKKRNIDLNQIMLKINKEYKQLIKIEKLRYSNKDEIVRIKNSKFNKIYEITLKSDKIINIEKLKKVVQSLRDLTINQYTPSRVAHRRAEMIREKKIYNCEIKAIENTIAKITLEAESGTYIKELVSGDDGRTTPSISEMLGTPCKVTELDVIEIKGE